MSTPSDPPPPTRSNHTALVVAGAVVLVVLLVTAIVLWASADRRYDDNVAAFARAPSGCDTTLDFDRAGEFTLYVETTGELPELRGDCDATASYDRDADDVPTVALELRTIDGETVELEAADGPSYDTGTFVGVGRNVVVIEEAGDHVITVDDDGGTAFAVAIGGAPDDGVAVLRWGAGAALLLGLIGGGALLVLGARRPDPAAGIPATTTATFTPASEASTWPTSPPGFPAPPPTTGASGPALPTPIPGQPPMTGPAPPAPGQADDDTTGPWGPPTA